MEGIPALTFWDVVINVFDLAKTNVDHVKKAPELADIYSLLRYVDYVPPSMPKSNGRAKLMILEDNDPVIKITQKSCSPNMRRVARTH
eukprot:9728445-Karenia_brevis.AAC.1